MTELVEPPLAADEAATLRGFLDYQRDVLRRKTEGLDAEQLGRGLPPTTMTLGGLLSHLAWVEHYWLIEVFTGRPCAEPWSDLDWSANSDADWALAADRSPADLRALFDASVASTNREIDAALATGTLDALALGRSGPGQVSLRWIVVHLIEEYARHLGHADLIREAIDGATGD